MSWSASLACPASSAEGILGSLIRSAGAWHYRAGAPGSSRAG